jgi:predicted nucleic acid-binding Zn ribbon protein
MPRFDFSCPRSSDHPKQYDVILRITHTAADFPQCDECGDVMEKDASRFNAQFRGAGFHAVDYRAPTRGH